MRIIIIEDEALIAKDLQKLLARLRPTWEVVAVLDSVAKSVAWLQNNPLPALAFMDIQLADGASFEIFEQINITFPVIFTTAYEQYAIRAFQVNSIGYLLKPIDEVELSQAIDKFQKSASALSAQNLQMLLQDLKVDAMPTPKYKERFLVNFKGGLAPISTEHIACFEKDEIIFLYTFEGKKYVTDFATMDEAESLLNPAQFYRANRQYIINIEAIEALKPTYKGIAVKLKLTTTPEIEVSREKVTAIKQWLNR